MIVLSGYTGSLGQYVKRDIEFQVKLPFGDNHKFESSKSLENSTFIHLAGISNPVVVEANPEISHQINVDSAVNLLRHHIRSGGKRFIFASTSHIYGTTPEFCLSTESDTPNPQSRYAEQKLLAEERLKEEAHSSTVELIIARIFSVFGLGMRKFYLAGMIEYSLKANGEFPLIANCNDVRDFSLPEQIAGDLEKLTKIEVDRPLTVNLCSGVAKTIEQQVLDFYPEFPKHNLLPGHSKIPRLVGSSMLKNKLMNQKRTNYERQ